MRFLVLKATPISVKMISLWGARRQIIVRGSSSLILPYWCDQVDDEKVVGVKEEANSSMLLNTAGYRILIRTSYPVTAKSLRSPVVRLSLPFLAPLSSYSSY